MSLHLKHRATLKSDPNGIAETTPPAMSVTGGVSRLERELLKNCEAEKTCRAASDLSPLPVILDKKVVSSDADRLTEKQELHRQLTEKIQKGLKRGNRTAKCWNGIDAFFNCGKEMDCVQWCVNCDTEHPMIQRCSKKYCPLCHWRITSARQEQVKKFAEHVNNPQHVVLTQRNFLNISREKMREHYRNLTRIREQKVWKNVLGGCTSVEMTNRGEGWHLHSHSLIDCKFICVESLAKAWGKLVGQEFAIVHRKEIDSGAYAKEICKYVCKPAEMLRWRAKDILNFIEAIHGTRFFFKFGTLLKDAKLIKQAIARDREPFVSKCSECEAENCFEFLPSSGMSTNRKLKFVSRI
jgi:hypothetical protein